MFNYKFLNIKTEIKHNFSSKFFPTTFISFASVKKEHTIDSQESESSLALCKRDGRAREGQCVCRCIGELRVFRRALFTVVGPSYLLTKCMLYMRKKAAIHEKKGSYSLQRFASPSTSVLYVGSPNFQALYLSLC